MVLEKQNMNIKVGRSFIS